MTTRGEDFGLQKEIEYRATGGRVICHLFVQVKGLLIKFELSSSLGKSLAKTRRNKYAESGW